MKIWKSFAASGITHSMAHYLTAIHGLRARMGYARVSDVARELDVTKGSVSIQVKHLREKGLVEEDRNRFLLLTPGGEEIAHELLQNRKILTEFLVALLGIEEDQAKVDACKMEHLLSRDTCHRLLALVHLIQSDDPAARQFRERFRQYSLDCSGAGVCRLCSVEHGSEAIREEVRGGTSGI